MKLSSVTKKINVVISLSKIHDNYSIHDIVQFLEFWLIDNTSLYAFIVHDKDYNDDGTMKTTHIHLVAVLKKSARLSTSLNKLADTTHVSTLAITIDSCNSIESSIQYLIHKNAPHKYQYSIEKVNSNLSIDELSSYMDLNELNVFDYQYIYNICCECITLSQVISKIGIPLFERHIQVIKIIWNDIKGLEDLHRKYY